MAKWMEIRGNTKKMCALYSEKEDSWTSLLAFIERNEDGSWYYSGLFNPRIRGVGPTKQMAMLAVEGEFFTRNF